MGSTTLRIAMILLKCIQAKTIANRGNKAWRLACMMCTVLSFYLYVNLNCSLFWIMNTINLVKYLLVVIFSS